MTSLAVIPNRRPDSVNLRERRTRRKRSHMATSVMHIDGQPGAGADDDSSASRCPARATTSLPTVRCCWTVNYLVARPAAFGLPRVPSQMLRHLRIRDRQSRPLAQTRDGLAVFHSFVFTRPTPRQDSGRSKIFERSSSEGFDVLVLRRAQTVSSHSCTNDRRRFRRRISYNNQF
jgi:hypothetical protein